MATVNSGPDNSAPTPPASVGERQWADLVLTDLGAPVSGNTEADLLGWMTLEEPQAQWWGGFGTPSNPTRINPLNTGLGTQPSPLTGGTTSSGLGTFPDLTTAAYETAKTIAQQNMAPIAAALKGDAPPSSFFPALQSSPWAGSHYAGDSFPVGIAGGPPVTSYAGSLTPSSVGPSGSLVGILGTPIPNPVGPIARAGGNAAADAIKALLPSTSTAVRIGIGLVGIVLLFIGVNALTRSRNGDGPITVVTRGAQGASNAAKSSQGQQNLPQTRYSPAETMQRAQASDDELHYQRARKESAETSNSPEARNVRARAAYARRRSLYGPPGARRPGVVSHAAGDAADAGADAAELAPL